MTDTVEDSEWEPDIADIDYLEELPDRVQVTRGYTIINASDESELRYALEEASRMHSEYKGGARVVIGVHSDYDNMIHYVFTNESRNRDESYGMSAREILDRGGRDLAGEIEDAYRDERLGVYGHLPAGSQDFYQVHIFTDKQR